MRNEDSVSGGLHARVRPPTVLLQPQPEQRGRFDGVMIDAAPYALPAGFVVRELHAEVAQCAEMTFDGEDRYSVTRGQTGRRPLSLENIVQNVKRGGVLAAMRHDA